MLILVLRVVEYSFYAEAGRDRELAEYEENREGKLVRKPCVSRLNTQSIMGNRYKGQREVRERISAYTVEMSFQDITIYQSVVPIQTRCGLLYDILNFNKIR